MKNLIVFLLAFATQVCVYAQSVPELSSIQSLAELTAARDRINKEKNVPVEYAHHARIENALWHGIEVKDIGLLRNELKMEVSKESANGAKKMIAVLQEQYKQALKKESSWSGTTYTINNADVDIELKVNADKDEPVGIHTGAELTISFKPVYNEPYPAIAKKIAQDPDGVFYFLILDYFENNIEVWVNGISIFDGRGQSRYINERELNLNPFILGKEDVQLKIRVTPGLDKDGQPYPAIQKRSYATAELQKGMFKGGQFEPVEAKKIANFKEYVTDTLTEGDVKYSSYTGTYQYGSKELKAAFNFIADVSYQTSGWKGGKDLRNDHDLKDRVVALYQRLGKVIQERDARGLSDLLYAVAEEDAIANYNQHPSRYIDNWSKWVEMFESTNVIKIENDFDIDISEDGKLVYARPTTQKDMLRAIGKEKVIGFTHYIYMDQNTGELKFIR